MKSMKRIARESGLWYLLMGITGIVGLMYMPGQIVVNNDTAATAQNLKTADTLIRVGLLCNLACQITFIFLILSLRRLFEKVSPFYTRLMVTLVIIAIPIAFLNSLNLGAVVLANSGADYLSAFSEAQLEGFMLFFWDLHAYGIAIVAIFWGLWLLPFGYLVIRSGFIPKIFGVFLLVGGMGYILDSCTAILFPAYRDSLSMIFTIPSGLAEFAIIFWFLIKGVQQRESTPVVA